MRDTADDVADDVVSAMRTRQSIRAFLDKPVPLETVRAIIEVAAFTPSGSNLQPWNAHVLTGEPLTVLGSEIKTAYLADEPGHQRDYKYYTDELAEPFLSRRRACGWGLYGTLGISRGEKDRMKRQRSTNYNFFGAPVGMVLTIDSRLEVGSWMDFGGFLQSVMLIARTHGLHTCAQASIAEFPKIVRRHLPIPDNHAVVCGIALGYADFGARVNQFRTERCSVDEIATFSGF
jgi:nitroreductase